MSVPKPTVADVQAYLAAEGVTRPLADVTDAYAAEESAQAAVCRVPADGELWSAALAQALKRRVHRNLAMRAAPYGTQSAYAEGAVSTVRVGSDAEVRRLEAPFRKRVVG